MFASTKAGGMTFAFPNVCKVPAPPAPFIPVPFPSIGQCSGASGGTCTKKVKIMNKPVLHLSSEIPSTKGDEAGTMFGVISGTRGSVCKRSLGSMTVEVEGNPIVTAFKPIRSNGPNANAPIGAQLTPSQTKVIVPT